MTIHLQYSIWMYNTIRFSLFVMRVQQDCRRCVKNSHSVLFSQVIYEKNFDEWKCWKIFRKFYVSHQQFDTFNNPLKWHPNFLTKIWQLVVKFHKSLNVHSPFVTSSMRNLIRRLCHIETFVTHSMITSKVKATKKLIVKVKWKVSVMQEKIHRNLWESKIENFHGIFSLPSPI